MEYTAPPRVSPKDLNNHQGEVVRIVAEVLNTNSGNRAATIQTPDGKQFNVEMSQVCYVYV